MNTNLDAPLFDDADPDEDVISNPDDQQSHSWKVLIVDDEPSVHDVTLLALKRFEFQGHGLFFLHAYSAEEARKLLQEHDNITVALIDVVMESDDAGLNLVEYIRNELKNQMVRLVLRTGQPGVAPESSVIQNYDINDYKEKSELTKQKLTSTMYTALRSYRDLLALEQNRKGLEQVVSSTSTIYSIHDMKNFVDGLLKQVMSVVGTVGDTVCAQSSGFLIGCCGNDDTQSDIVLSGTGIYDGCENKRLSEVVDEDIQTRIQDAVKNKTNVHFERGSVFYFHNKLDGHGIIYLDAPSLSNDSHRQLIELFCSNIAVAYENVSLNEEIEDTQKEIIYTLGTIAEFRSKETSDHVQRVAEYAELIASKLGLPEKEIELLKLATPLHDIGKLAIPDSILHKPGKLTDGEFDVMKQHTTHGFEMLRHSKRDLLKYAAIIALSHQEKWDGSGYPNGEAGEDIHLYGRIVAVADVFDALGSKRCYKDGWELEEILDYMKLQRGMHFDPALIDILTDNLEEFIAIRNRYL